MPVRRGFHRIGLVAAAPFVIGAVVALGIAAYTGATLPQPNLITAFAPPKFTSHNFPDNYYAHDIAPELSRIYGTPVAEKDIVVLRGDPRETAVETAYISLGVAGGSLLTGLLLYLSSWAIGWIIAGFKSDTG